MNRLKNKDNGASGGLNPFWKKGFRNPKNFLLGFLVAVVLIFSIKPFLFTVGLIDAGLSAGGEDDGSAIYKVISFKPSLYNFFNEKKPGAVESYILRSAIEENDRRILDRYADIKPEKAPGLHKRFKDNFYFHHLTGTIDAAFPHEWNNLDNVALHILADSSKNDLTLSILEKIRTHLQPLFIRNLAEYTTWKGNSGLSKQILSRFPIDKINPLPPSPTLEFSLKALENYLGFKYKLAPGGLSENLLESPAFNEPSGFENDWYFSLMASKKKFAAGSFVMGLEPQSSKDNKVKNNAVRIMGFYAGRKKGKSRPRAGVRYRQHLPAENGFYIFSFDYCTATGKESPSLWFARGLRENHLPVTGGQWKKVVFVLNNAFNDYPRLNPLIRMWGTGTMKVDNVFLFKVKTTKFSIDEEYTRQIIPSTPPKRGNRK